MSNRMTEIIVFAVLMVASIGLLSSSNALVEQVVKAQNMTGNMTDSAGNMTQTEPTRLRSP